MTIFLNIYLFIYVITLIFIQFILTKYLHHNIIYNSLPYLNFYINKFSKFKVIYFLLLLFLTGLPPFILFFVKFNFLINILFKYNIFINIIIFLIFFLNMIFYIQIFYNKNINYDIIIKKNKNKNNINFKMIYLMIFFLFFSIFSIFFFADFIYLFKLIYKWQH